MEEREGGEHTHEYDQRGICRHCGVLVDDALQQRTTPDAADVPNLEEARLNDADHAIEDLTIDIAGLLFEVRIATAAVHFGIKTLATRQEMPTLARELDTLLRLSDQACEALATLQEIFVQGLSKPDAAQDGR